ncbi:MAG: hypothetical protein B1H12_03320 [Desulfobacteraceae bacterium 4484_190.2]|nr:MAG: hypothetical protein B1H12_03320 [Desulfobacteraceae bacterium 4484_190.2]
MEFTTIKGFKDILPEDVETWQRLESEARRVFHSFGFKEIRPPLLERTELFSRGIGQETDIVSKEMYTLKDSKGRGLTLRPEATASVVRAYVQHRLYLKNPIQKLFTIGPMFRHERPQKGRFRQFHQINAEIFGDPGSRSDADIIIMAMFFLETIGLSGLGLHINSLGCDKCRARFKKELKDYLGQKTHTLCTDCQRRAEINPLRVFDCKVEGCKEVVSSAPSILDYICEKKAFNWVNDLRRTGIWVETEYSSKGLKAQMKRAGRLGARKVLIVGEDELASGKGILRDMGKKVQEEVELQNIVNNLKGILKESTG